VSHALLSSDCEISAGEYAALRRLILKHSGIDLGARKLQLVRYRLMRLLRTGGFRSFGDYCEHVRRDSSGRALHSLLDAMTTNTTYLFREPHHYSFLAARLREWLRRAGPRPLPPLRIWSAGCSSGEEPHSIALVCADALRERPDVAWRILATDLSSRMLARARQGVYEWPRLATVPPLLRRFFRVECLGRSARAHLDSRLQARITWARLNLTAGRFPFRGGLDFIFCRNVMIYFNQPTQERLVNEFARHLRPGGYLLIGHAEALHGIRHPLRYVEPAVFQMPPTRGGVGVLPA